MIRKGAEADLYVGEWYGCKAIFKVRVPKAYRQPQLDFELRRRRTLQEASLLAEAREAGVSTPVVYFVDPVKAEIVMQYVEGRRLKEVLEERREVKIRDLCSRVGKMVALLHENQIMHGDLTTSNFIVTNRGALAVIDFGLSFYSRRLEDRAVDLHLVKEVLTSAHSRDSRDMYGWIMKGYADVSGEDFAEKMLLKVREIERRGRYARFS